MTLTLDLVSTDPLNIVATTVGEEISAITTNITNFVNTRYAITDNGSIYFKKMQKRYRRETLSTFLTDLNVQIDSIATFDGAADDDEDNTDTTATTNYIIKEYTPANTTTELFVGYLFPMFRLVYIEGILYKIPKSRITYEININNQPFQNIESFDTKIPDDLHDPTAPTLPIIEYGANKRLKYSIAPYSLNDKHISNLVAIVNYLSGEVLRYRNILKVSYYDSVSTQINGIYTAYKAAYIDSIADEETDRDAFDILKDEPSIYEETDISNARDTLLASKLLHVDMFLLYIENTITIIANYADKTTSTDNVPTTTDPKYDDVPVMQATHDINVFFNTLTEILEFFEGVSEPRDTTYELAYLTYVQTHYTAISENEPHTDTTDYDNFANMHTLWNTSEIATDISTKKGGITTLSTVTQPANGGNMDIEFVRVMIKYITALNAWKSEASVYKAFIDVSKYLRFTDILFNHWTHFVLNHAVTYTANGIYDQVRNTISTVNKVIDTYVSVSADLSTDFVSYLSEIIFNNILVSVNYLVYIFKDINYGKIYLNINHIKAYLESFKLEASKALYIKWYKSHYLSEMLVAVKALNKSVIKYNKAATPVRSQQLKQHHLDIVAIADAVLTYSVEFDMSESYSKRYKHDHMYPSIGKYLHMITSIYTTTISFDIAAFKTNYDINTANTDYITLSNELRVLFSANGTIDGDISITESTAFASAITKIDSMITYLEAYIGNVTHIAKNTETEKVYLAKLERLKTLCVTVSTDIDTVQENIETIVNNLRSDITLIKSWTTDLDVYSQNFSDILDLQDIDFIRYSMVAFERYMYSENFITYTSAANRETRDTTYNSLFKNLYQLINYQYNVNATTVIGKCFDSTNTVKAYVRDSITNAVYALTNYITTESTNFNTDNAYVQIANTLVVRVASYLQSLDDYYDELDTASDYDLFRFMMPPHTLFLIISAIVRLRALNNTADILNYYTQLPEIMHMQNDILLQHEYANDTASKRKYERALLEYLDPFFTRLILFVKNDELVYVQGIINEMLHASRNDMDLTTKIVNNVQTHISTLKAFADNTTKYIQGSTTHGITQTLTGPLELNLMLAIIENIQEVVDLLPSIA